MDIIIFLQSVKFQSFQYQDTSELYSPDSFAFCTYNTKYITNISKI